jgi:amidase/aspartyl-tRNA(Asn)/glutamyl-tRNA(Gln) amidotransferase subunit A
LQPAWDRPPHCARLLELARRAARSTDDYKRDDGIRSEVYGAFSGQLEESDLIVSTPSPRDETLRPSEVNGVLVDPYIGWCLTHLASFTGQPAISVPADFTEDGWPVGIRLIGRRFDETTVLAAAATIERVRPLADGTFRPRSREHARQSSARSGATSLLCNYHLGARR